MLWRVSTPHVGAHVATKRPKPQEQEPIGIVISHGHTPEPTPRFSAYIYGIVEDQDETPDEVKVVA
jgi:hypothetical protein